MYKYKGKQLQNTLRLKEMFCATHWHCEKTTSKFITVGKDNNKIYLLTHFGDIRNTCPARIQTIFSFYLLVFSSPGLKTQRQAYSITMFLSSVHPPSKFSNFFSSEANGPKGTKFHSSLDLEHEGLFKWFQSADQDGHFDYLFLQKWRSSQSETLYKSLGSWATKKLFKWWS